MPIYEYGCKQCGHALDALQKIADEPLVDCPECGTASLKRLISAPRFRLKGSGWYETDFKSDNQRNLAKSDSDGDSSSKSDGKSGDGKSNGSQKSAAAGKSDSAAAGQSAKGASGSAGASTGSKSAGSE